MRVGLSILAVLSLAIGVWPAQAQSSSVTSAAQQVRDPVQPPTPKSSAQVVSVVGEVKKPGVVVWQQGMTVEQAIELAGGLTENANFARSEIQRQTGGATSRIVRIKKLKLTTMVIPGDVLIAGKKWL